MRMVGVGDKEGYLFLRPDVFVPWLVVFEPSTRKLSE